MIFAETDAQIAEAVQVLKDCASNATAQDGAGKADDDVGGRELLYRAASNGDDEIALASLSGRRIGDSDYTWTAFPLRAHVNADVRTKIDPGHEHAPFGAVRGTGTAQAVGCRLSPD